MLTPLMLPTDAPPSAQKRAAEYLFGLSDVAALFAVSRVSAHDWTIRGRRTGDGDKRHHPIPHLRPPSGNAREPLRYRWADLKSWAESQHLQLHPEALHPVLQRLAGIDPGNVVWWLNESAAARQLRMHRSTLQKGRVEGRLNPIIETRPGRTEDGFVRGFEYAHPSLELVTEGKIPLWVKSS
jgi:hypothetical protein